MAVKNERMTAQEIQVAGSRTKTHVKWNTATNEENIVYTLIFE